MYWLTIHRNTWDDFLDLGHFLGGRATGILSPMFQRRSAGSNLGERISGPKWVPSKGQRRLSATMLAYGTA